MKAIHFLALLAVCCGGTVAAVGAWLRTRFRPVRLTRADRRAWDEANEIVITPNGRAWMNSLPEQSDHAALG